jgi:2-amino-4-hydroxy-6-hydroxymethyldihydropteridine diphosphokinase
MSETIRSDEWRANGLAFFLEPRATVAQHNVRRRIGKTGSRKVAIVRQDADIFIAIGANLPGPHGQSALANCKAAVEALRGLPGLRLAGVSPWYETEPIPPGGPPYVNGVVWLVGQAEPGALLASLQAIEARGARVRGIANAPRTLDLDIIAIGRTIRAAPDPILPHPRAHLRRFVLQPLSDLRPCWVHPVLGQTAAALLAGLPEQGIRRL